MSYRQFVSMNDYIPADVSSSVMLSSTEVDDYVDLYAEPEKVRQRSKPSKKLTYYCSRTAAILLLEILLVVALICDSELCGISASVHSLWLSYTGGSQPPEDALVFAEKALPAYFNDRADRAFVVRRPNPANLSVLENDIFPTVMVFNATVGDGAGHRLSALSFVQNPNAALYLDVLDPKRRKVRFAAPNVGFSYWRQYVGKQSSYLCGSKRQYTNLSIVPSFSDTSNLPLWWLNFDDLLKAQRISGCYGDFAVTMHLHPIFCLDAIVFRYLAVSQVTFNATQFAGNLMLDFDLQAMNESVLLSLNYSYLQQIYLVKAPEVVYFSTVSSNIVFYLPVLSTACRIDPAAASYDADGVCKVSVYGVVYRNLDGQDYEEQHIEVTQPLQYGSHGQVILADALRQCQWRQLTDYQFVCSNGLYSVAEVDAYDGWLCQVISYDGQSAVYCYCTACE